MSDKRRCVHLAPGHVPLDTRVFHKEALTLRDEGFDVVVIARAGEDLVPPTVKGITIRTLPVYRSRLRRFVGGSLRLLRIAWRERGDVYHLHDVEAWPVGVVLRLAGRRVVLDCHADSPRLGLSRGWVPRRF
jgi:hypothetical protein